jgi:hypothetical protein
MPRFNFHLGPQHSVQWHFDRHPDEGELIALGDTYGVCRVGAMLPRTDPTADAEYDAERIRALTSQELMALAKEDAAFKLPPRGTQQYGYTA